MGSDDRGNELEGRMQRIDEITKSPQERATRLWGLLAPSITELDDNIPDYDLMCLAIEVCAMLAQGNYPWALDGAMKLSKDLYMFHYYVFGEQELNDAKGDPSPIPTDPTTANDGPLNRRKGNIQLVESDGEGEDTRHIEDERTSGEDAEHSIRDSDETTRGPITGKLD